MKRVLAHTTTAMSTVVEIRLVSDRSEAALHDALSDALGWFAAVEAACSRFDESSELRQLCVRTGEAVVVSEMLFDAIHFAVTLAEETHGAFDPTIGGRLAARGFDRNYRTGERTSRAPDAATATYRDVELGVDEKTITLHAPLLLDLGAVAKGLAVDLAARALRSRELADFAIDAGGDMYLAGCNAQGEPWRAGIRHPRQASVVETVTLSDAALCTSGDYERVASDGGHHLMNGAGGTVAEELASVSVVAEQTIVADGLATAAFALGPSAGLALLTRQGVRGIFYTPSLERLSTE